MQIDQERFSGTREHVRHFPAAEHKNWNRNQVREKEQSVEDLRAAVDSLQPIVCELLLRNQALRMVLDGKGESVTSSSVIALPNEHPRAPW